MLRAEAVEVEGAAEVEEQAGLPLLPQQPQPRRHQKMLSILS